QSVQATDVGRAYVLNGGGTLIVSVHGDADDNNIAGDAVVNVIGTGITQNVTAGNTAQATVDNDGLISISVVADASGSFSAVANADVFGIVQDVTATGTAG